MQDVQALCFMYVSNMDFFKTVVGGQLVDMDEASLEAEGSRGVTDDNPASQAQANEHKF